jgi:sugar/nucleoside kinase (ribokinase family)
MAGAGRPWRIGHACCRIHAKGFDKQDRLLPHAGSGTGPGFLSVFIHHHGSTTMTQAAPRVVGIGNAVVDVIAPVEDRFLTKHDIHKGTMTLVDQTRSRQIYESMPPATMASGGSVANSMAGVASFGGSAGFIGRVCDDELGRFFVHDMRAVGVSFDVPPVSEGDDTSRSMILVSPDAQRSMTTYLGASTQLERSNLDHTLIRETDFLFLEGYLWDSEKPREAMAEAASVAREARTSVAFTMSDPFLADRYRDEIRAFLPGYVDILFANEVEITSLYRVNTVGEALELARKDVQTAIVTRSEKGCVVMHHEETWRVPAERVSQLVDTTGAGDQFAAGFLFGLSKSLPLPDCARLGAIAAAEVISHVGPRPKVELATLIPPDIKAQLG